MQRFQYDFSAIILNEIALEGLDGITIEALCKRLSNNPNWPLKPVDDSIRKIVWSFVVCLKNIDFYRLESPRDPLIIYNRFEYTHSEFGSLYEPITIPQDIYPNHPIEDGQIMGSCKEYYTRFNLGSFPRKISVEEAEKRWDRCLVIVANQETRTKVLIPDDKQCTLVLSLRYYLILERIGRSRYLGEASFGGNSLKSVCSNSKTLSYIRNRLTDDGLIKNQTLPFSRSLNIQIANRIVISSLTKFFVKQHSLIDLLVSKIVNFLKLKPNFTASYDQVKNECNINSAKTFKQPLLKKYCDTNLMLKYRELYPDAPKSEYLYKKKIPKKERVIRCIKLKCIEKIPEVELEKKTVVEGREFKLDCSYERQVLRWIEKHGNLGVTLSDISCSFKFTTDRAVERMLNKLVNLKYISKHYCDRGRSKVFSYTANNYSSMFDNDNNELELMSTTKCYTHGNLLENNINEVNVPYTNTTVDKSKSIELDEIKTKNDNELVEIKTENDNEVVEVKTQNDNELIEIKTEIDNELIEIKTKNDNLHTNSSENENKLSDKEPLITRVMEIGYCKKIYKSIKQSISLTNRFFFRRQIIFSMLSTESIISLVSLKKAIIETERDNPKFIGTLDAKTLIKIIGYFEKMQLLKSVQYRVTCDAKIMNHTFVGTPSIDFTSEDAISFMNSFLNQFNNAVKTTRANKKWNLEIHNSPEPKINIAELKLPRFMKMRSLHEYLYYIVYDHPGESLTNACSETEAAVVSYRNDIVNGDEAELPKVYYPNIGWKMFVPPLQKYSNYPDGWFFVSDIVHHMPLDLMLKIVNFNKTKVNLEKLVPYATHPVFKFLPLMCLSSNVRSMLSQGLKKHIQNTLSTLRLLCMIGLIQFGEKTHKDTELIYAYLNRRASLLNTVKSSPNYYRISDMDYEVRNYEFISSYELETFWLDTWYFCTNTPLGCRMMKSVNKPKRQEMCEKSKIAIEEACTSRGPLEAVAQDDGVIPGDNKGAAGFDSHLFSHLPRNWNLKKKSSTTVFPKRRTSLSAIKMQRIKKHNRKQVEKKKAEITSNQMFKMRYKWTQAEDQVLLFWKLGTMIIKQVKSHAFLSYGIKDVVRSIFGKYYRSKSIDSYLRRIRVLMRYSSIEANVNNLHSELKADEEIKEFFKSDFEKQHELYKTKKYKAMRDLIISCIKQFIELLRERGTTIDTQCTIYKKKKNLPKSLEDCKQEAETSSNQFDLGNLLEGQYNCSEEIYNLQNPIEETEQMFSKEEILMSIVISLIHSSLTNQSTDPRISLSYLQAFKQYPENILKQAFDIIKNNNIITCNQYHQASLPFLLTTSHIIQSKSYEYSPKFSSILVGNTDLKRYKDAFNAYSEIKEVLSEQKTLLLYPSFGLCPALTSLCLTNAVDLSVEFDKKYLEYMLDENLEEGSKCLKNTLKRMRSRHFDLLTTSNNSIEYIKIITSVTKQLKNYQVICKLKQPLQKFEEEINVISERIFSRTMFEPQLQFIDKMNNLSKKILMFCKKKEEYGATPRDIKVHFDSLSLEVLAKSLKDLKRKDLILKAGFDEPTYVHYEHAIVWLVKVPSINWSSVEAAMKDDTLSELTVTENTDVQEPLTKKARKEPEIKDANDEQHSGLKIHPWTRMNLTINKENLETFLNSIMSKIIKKPGIYLKCLIKEYLPVLQQMHTRELIETLAEMKCVKLIHVGNIQKPSFFSNPSSHHNLILSDANGMEDNSSIMLEPTLDCEIRFGYFSSKFGNHRT